MYHNVVGYSKYKNIDITDKVTIKHGDFYRLVNFDRFSENHPNYQTTIRNEDVHQNLRSGFVKS